MTFEYARTERIGVVIAALVTFGLALTLFAPAPAAAADKAVPQLLGSLERANADIAPFPKWTGALRRYAAERTLEDRPCPAAGSTDGTCALQQWKSFVDGLKGRDPLAQLEAVNAYVNTVPYQTDRDRYGTVDHWATPREFFGRSGDCEDYAIAKYLSLRKLGWSADALRILVVNDEVRRELHAVLVAFHNGTAYVLDNLARSVRDHRSVRTYRPIFSINETAWFHHRGWSPGGTEFVAAPTRPQPAQPRPAPVASPVRPVAAPAIAAPLRVAAPVRFAPPAAVPAAAFRTAQYRHPRLPAREQESLAALFASSGGRH